MTVLEVQIAKNEGASYLSTPFGYNSATGEGGAGLGRARQTKNNA